MPTSQARAGFTRWSLFRKGLAITTSEARDEGLDVSTQGHVPIPTDPYGRGSHQYRRGDRMRVLAIHETALLRQIVSRSLRQFDGIDEVVVARTVEDAITELQRGRFDLVISDWYLGASSMSGLELLRAFRSAGWAIPVGLIAAEVDDTRHDMAVSAGADFVLEKPFSPDMLAKAIGLTEAGEWVPSIRPRSPGTSTVEVQLAALLSKLCDVSVTVAPSPTGANFHAHRVISRYVDERGVVQAHLAFELRLAAALAGAMTRISPPVAERNASSGVLSEALLDALSELADVLTRCISHPRRTIHFESLDLYAPGEHHQSGDKACQTQNFYVGVPRYSAGGLSVIVEQFNK